MKAEWMNIFSDREIFFLWNWKNLEEEIIASWYNFYVYSTLYFRKWQFYMNIHMCYKQISFWDYHMTYMYVCNITLLMTIRLDSYDK